MKLRFQDLAVLDLAFTHSSFRNEFDPKSGDNERLEFLGDTVLGILTADYLYHKYYDHPEGFLSRMKSKIVSGAVLDQISRELDLHRFLLLGRGEREHGSQSNKRSNANLVEALLGAIYLDSGLEAARNFMVPYLERYSDQLPEIETVQDYKTSLQEYCQKSLKRLPEYRLLEEEGPDHEKMFLVEAKIADRYSGKGKARSKKLAEQLAAKEILMQIGQLK